MHIDFFTNRTKSSIGPLLVWLARSNWMCNAGWEFYLRFNPTGRGPIELLVRFALVKKSMSFWRNCFHSRLSLVGSLGHLNPTNNMLVSIIIAVSLVAGAQSTCTCDQAAAMTAYVTCTDASQCTGGRVCSNYGLDCKLILLNICSDPINHLFCAFFPFI